MKYSVPIIFLVVFAVLLTLGEEESSGRGQTSLAKAAAMGAGAKTGARGYGERGILNTWPGDSEGYEISPSPLAKNYYVIVDGSGSMRESGCSNGKQKINVAKASLTRFIDKIPQGDNIGLYVFDGKQNGERVALAAQRHQAVKTAVQAIHAGSSTPLGQAAQVGLTALTEQGKRQLGYGEYHLVIVTDGEASNSYTLRNVIDDLLRNTPIIVHTIGFCINDKHSLNQPGYVLYKAADNPEMLEQGLDGVLAEAESFAVAEFEGN